jgi:membrane dipeptidase
MKKLIPVFLLLISASVHAQKTGIHYRSVLVDTHNDILSSAVLEGKDISHRLDVGHSDLPRWMEGGVDVQFFSVWTDKRPRRPEGFFHDANEEIDSLYSIIRRNPGKIILAKNYRDVKRGIKQQKLVALIGVEGGHMIENDLKNLETLYDRGMRYLTLTWNNSTSWASSAMDEVYLPDSLSHKGLTDFGIQVVRRMNELGIIVDLSHAGEKTFFDAIAIVKKPVFLSHSSVWNLSPVFRNLKDEQIRAVARNNGVICINFYPEFIDSNYFNKSEELGRNKKRIKDSLQSLFGAEMADKKWNEFRDQQLKPLLPRWQQVVDHIDYIVKLVGDDYVGIGADFDGVSALPDGIKDVTSYPMITGELIRRGYSEKSIKKILGGNALRVMKANFR